MATITLYEVDGCPFCTKVTNKLDELGLEYDSIKVPSSHSQRDEVKAVSGQTGVPVLVDEEHGVDAMPESSDIVAFLEKTYGNAS